MGMIFKVVINDIEITRDWSWDKIYEVKNVLKKLGFKWTGEYWIGKVYSLSSIKRIKDLLELDNKEVESIISSIVVNSEGGVIGIELPSFYEFSEELKSCVLDTIDDVHIVSIPCYIRNFVKSDRKYINQVSTFREYIEYAVSEFKKMIRNCRIIGDLELALSRSIEYVISSQKLQHLFERRVKWWTVHVNLNYAELNFLSRGLRRELSELKIEYNKIDAEGRIYHDYIKVVTFRKVERSEGIKWLIEFPVFFRDTIIDILRKYGYIVKENEYSVRRIVIPKDQVKLYSFQEEALHKWLRANCRGTIIIPTGGGKTFIGLRAISELKVPTLILVTTEELLNQWYDRLLKYLGVKAGRLGAGFSEIRDVTISIYHSAVNNIDVIKDKFDLVIADESHHVPAETFKEVLFKVQAPYRLALSATPTRADHNEKLIFIACGEPVYKVSYTDLIRYGLVVPIRHYRIYTKLNSEERKMYEKAGNNIMHLKAIAFKARNKINIVKKIVEMEYELGSKVIIFTQYIQQAEDIYRELKSLGGIALLTSETRDRESIFRAFAKGNVRVIVTTTVLDEGIDVPDADVAIIVSGTGSPRQMIQRIGRVVRASENKREARIYEIIARNTIEEALSNLRHPKHEIEEIECRIVFENELDFLLSKLKSRIMSLNKFLKLDRIDENS